MSAYYRIHGILQYDSEESLANSITPLQKHGFINSDGHWLEATGDEGPKVVSKAECSLVIPERVCRNISPLIGRLVDGVVGGKFITSCTDGRRQGRIVTPASSVEVDLERWADRNRVVYIDTEDLVYEFHLQNSPNPDLLQTRDRPHWD